MRGFLVPLEIPIALLRKSGNDVGVGSGNDVGGFKELPWAGSGNNRGRVRGTTVGGAEEWQGWEQKIVLIMFPPDYFFLPIRFWANTRRCSVRSLGMASESRIDKARSKRSEIC